MQIDSYFFAAIGAIQIVILLLVGMIGWVKNHGKPVSLEQTKKIDTLLRIQVVALMAVLLTALVFRFNGN